MIYNYDSLKQLSRTLGRSVQTLFALTPQIDPFYITPQRQIGAEWFAKLWNDMDFPPGTHLRRIHYRLVSHGTGYVCDDGTPYLNTMRCDDRLRAAAQDARYLELVPIEAFVDRRNEEPIEYLVNSEFPATLNVYRDPGSVEFEPDFDRPLPETPQFVFNAPTIPQRYHIELWCEKTTMNDILLPIARQYNLNLITAKGDISTTRCFQLIERAVRTQRPVRILYISDFDPQGWLIPVAGARKIEFLNLKNDHSLDIQLRPIVLTHEQCVRYRLPRTPIKETITGNAHGKRFEERFGEGGTELDALEANHPGELQRIILREVRRYYDGRLAGNVRRLEADFQEQLNAVHEDVCGRYAEQRTAIIREHQDLIEQCNAALERFREPLLQVEERLQQIHTQIARDLREEAPDLDEIQWPEPKAGDEDDDPLFDSTRDYLDQVARYKEHQGKSALERVSAEQRKKDADRARTRRARLGRKASEAQQ